MNLNYNACINNLSYGITSINILKELCRQSVNVSLHPIGMMDCLPEEVSIVRGCLENSIQYDYDSPCLKIFHANGLKDMIGRGQKIGFPIFELNNFTPTEKHQLSGLDKIIVASKWGKNVLQENGVNVPVFVANLGVDRKIFNEELVGTNDISKDTATKFLMFGKWEIRKGHDIILDAFCKAFTPQDNVKLIGNCFNHFIGKEGNHQWEQMYMLSEMATKIHIFSERLSTQLNVAQLMSSVDCGLFVSRAEGWNLGLLEMMSMGKHVIATNCTAHTEFANPNNSHMVEVGELEDAYDGVFFNGSGKWPSITENSIDQIVEHMRTVHKLKQSGCLQPNIYGINTAKQLSWENSAKQVLEAING